MFEDQDRMERALFEDDAAPRDHRGRHGPSPAHGASPVPVHARASPGPTLESELAPEESSRLAATASTMDVPRRGVIFTPGERAETLYTVASGVVRIYLATADGRRQIIGFLHPGGVLGFAHGDVHTCGAEAVTAVRLRRYSRRAFAGLCERMPRLERALLRVAAHELTLAQDHIVMLGRKSARERVAAFLCLMARRTSLPDTAGTRLWLPMSQADIADYLGLTIETVSRVLTGFKRDGAIRALSRDRLEVLDFASLENIAGKV